MLHYATEKLIKKELNFIFYLSLYFVILNLYLILSFHNNSLKLVTNYFSDRMQAVKFNNKLSPMEPINLGVPQGSVLGPLNLYQ